MSLYINISDVFSGERVLCFHGPLLYEAKVPESFMPSCMLQKPFLIFVFLKAVTEWHSIFSVNVAVCFFMSDLMLCYCSCFVIVLLFLIKEL